MLRSIFAIAVLSIAAAGCNGDALGLDDAGSPDQAAPPDLTVVPDLTQVPSGIGDPCSGGGFPPSQGDCPGDNQLCLGDQIGFSGGYCTQMCGAGNGNCPWDAKCVDTGMFGSFCFAPCQTDADCRDNTYVCSQDHVCVSVQVATGGSVRPGTNNGAACVMPVQQPTGTGLFGKNRQISDSSNGRMGAETELSVDPKTNHVLVSWIDIAQSGTSYTGFSGSTDDGMTFAKPVSLPLDMTVNNGNSQSDPVTAVDSMGEFFITWIGYDQGRGGNTINMNVYVARSMDDGATFPDLFKVTPAGEWASGLSLDKPWIAMGPDDTVYVTWMRQTNNNVNIRMASSKDHGQTWSTPITVDDNARATYDRNLAQPTVAADGRIYVAWVEIDANSATSMFGSKLNRVYLQRFNPDGTKDGANVRVSAGNDSPPFEDPSIAAAGSEVYVGFISGDSTGAWDVRVATSLDSGATFSPSVKVNDDPTCATHFHHQIAVDMAGNVHAIWFDNRYLDGNVFWAMSPPAAMGAPLKFGANQFVNDVSFEFTTRRDMSNWLGDYLGLTTANKEIYAVWTDGRLNNNSQIYFTKAQIPGL